MNETIKMRVNVTLGATCAGESMGRNSEFYVPVTSEEKQLLSFVPQCEEGKTTQLKNQLPENLYKRIRSTAIHEVENIVYKDGYDHGYYDLDVQRWFHHDLREGSFCQKTSNGQFKLPDSDILYSEEDEELFNFWYEYEELQIRTKGMDYLRIRYGKELAEQTDISAVEWSLEF